VYKARKFRRSVGDTIRLLENTEMSVMEVAKDYHVNPNFSVKCNTIKMQESTAMNMPQVSRTAGHFGLFSPCGIIIIPSVGFSY